MTITADELRHQEELAQSLGTALAARIVKQVRDLQHAVQDPEVRRVALANVHDAVMTELERLGE